MDRRAAGAGGWRLRGKVLAVLVLVGLVPAMVLAALSRGTVRSLAERAGDEAQSAIEREAQQRLVTRASALARADDTLFGQVQRRADTVAGYVRWLYEHPDYFPPFLEGGTPLERQPAGHLLNDPATPVGVFVPRQADMSAARWREVGLLSQVDPLLAATPAANQYAARTWVITASGIVRIYPNPGLGHPGSPVGPADDLRDAAPFRAAGPERNPGGGTVWTEPYIDPAGDGPLVSAVSPIHDAGGQLLAVAGVDMRLADVVAGVLAARTAAGGYAFLADRSGRILGAAPEAYTDLGLARLPGPAGAAAPGPIGAAAAPVAALSASTLPGVRALVPALGSVDAAGVLLQFTGAGGRRYLGAALLPEAGWVLGVAAPAAAVEGAAAATRAEIQAAESRLLQRWGLALAAVLLAIVLAGHWATRALTRPVSQLLEGTRRLAADLTYRLPPLGADELGDLARAFNRMAAALQDAHAREVENARRAGEERQRALRDREVAVLEERNRLAREIHDTLAQGLTGIVLQLEAAEDALAAGEAAGAQPRLQRARALARDSLQEARRSVWNLRPQAMAAGGLAPALANLAAGLEADGFTVVRDLPDLAVPPLAGETLYRIAQEAVANVRRHSGARRVEIALRRVGGVDGAAGTGGPEVWEVRVADDGRGFAAGALAAPRPGGGFGLWAMRERAEALGGQVRVTGRPGAGTVVVARVPAATGGDAGGAGDSRSDRR